MSRRHDAVIFDLDGTLLDSLEDLADSVNHALSERGLPTRTIDEIRRFVGEGQVKLIERALPEGRAELRDELLASFRRHYVDDPARKTRPYPGVEGLVVALRERGYRLAVLSNKPDLPTRKLVDHYFPAGTFEVAYGERPGIPRKPDPTSALGVARELGVDPARCAFVGDTAIDMKTAAAAGMFGIGVLWGFRSREEIEAGGARVLASSCDQVLAALDR